MKYRHFKGGIYTYVVQATLECDRDQNIVVYEDENGHRWARPSEEFFGTVTFNGEEINRFEEIGGDDV